MTGILSAMVGHLEIGHMLFVENLLLFSLLYALFKTVCRTGHKPADGEFSLLWLLAIAIVMGAAVQTVRHFSPQDRWINVWRILYFEPARYPQYVIMFILGLLASRRSALENISNKSGITCLGVALQFATDGLISRPIPEFFFIAVLTTVLSFTLGYLINRIWPKNLIFA